MNETDANYAASTMPPLNDAAQRAAERIVNSILTFTSDRENWEAIIREETAADVAELVAALEHLLDVPNPMASGCDGCKDARAVLAKHR